MRLPDASAGLAPAAGSLPAPTRSATAGVAARAILPEPC